MKKRRAKVTKWIIVVITAVLLEVLYFNFQTVALLADGRAKKDVGYAMEDMTAVNWLKEEDRLVSQPDPQLFIKGVDGFVRSVKVDFVSDQPVDGIVLFYTNNDWQDYNYIIKEGQQSLSAVFDINEYVQEIRIDIGDLPGTVLHSVGTVVNPVNWNISVSRIIAVILIYLAGTLLFKLQRMPDYGLNAQGNQQ